jgi:hypothetical protein
MTRIALRVEQNGARNERVVAETLGANNQATTKRGNAFVDSGSTIQWQSTGGATYRVFFFDLDTGTLGWWFDPADASYDSGASPTGPFLEVGPGRPKSTTLVSGAPERIKYEVRAVANNVIPLDPVIIIRPMAPPPSQDGSVLLAVTSAVVGAAVAAAATAYMLSN